MKNTLEILKNLFQKEISQFDTPERGSNSLNLAYVHGSANLSDLGMVVPNYAFLNCEIRLASAEITKEYIEEEINKLALQIGVIVGDFEKAIRSTGKDVEYCDISVAGYYEVQLLQENSVSNCVVFGAGPIEMSHAADEYVLISTVEDTQAVIEAYLDNKYSL